MADVEMMIIVKDDDLKAEAQEEMRELIDAGKAGVMTFDEFGDYIVKLFGPKLDVIGEGIEKVNKYIAKLQGKPEPEAEEEIPDIGDVIAEAALETWHRKPGGLKPRKRVVKPDPPGLVTDEPLEYIEPPDDQPSIIKAARRTWSKGRSLFGGNK